jgi:YidC/Oxa1 family membrane protein insertase
MIVPFLVLFGVFYAVAYPLTNTLHIDSAKVTEALNYVNTIPGYTAASGATNATYQEIYFLKDFSCFQNIDAIQQIFSADQLNTITMFEKGFNTFGMNLFAIPQDYGLWSPMILFPVICFASNVLTQFITMRINGKNNPMQQQQGCMKVMMYAMPLFSAYIAYIVPSAVAFYWIVSSLVSLVQSVIVGKLFSPQRMTATSEARHAALMFEQEALVQYNYVPHGLSESAEENTNSKKKKKK